MYFQHVVNVSLGNIPLILSMIEKLIYLSQHSQALQKWTFLSFWLFATEITETYLI